jgi:hypothetical protein
MSDADFVARYALTSTKIVIISGVSEKTAGRWLEAASIPEPVKRLVRIVYGDARPEDFRP